MPNEFDALTKKKSDLHAQLAEVDAKLNQLKKERADALLKELRELGVNLPPPRKKGKIAGGKKPRRCKTCGEPGHNARTCPKKARARAQQHVSARI